MNSMGGTGGYIVSRKGAEKMLDFINKTGSTNGIDTLIQKSANELNIYYPKPHLIFTDCYRGDSSIDTDIQFDHSKDLVKTVDERLTIELEFYKDNNISVSCKLEFDEVLKLVQDKEMNETFYFRNEDENRIKDVINSCVHKYYTLENTLIFIVPESINVSRYFHRFKKNGIFNIDDVFIQ